MAELPGDLRFYRDSLKELYLKFENILSPNRINIWIMQFEPEHREIAILVAQKLAYFGQEDVSRFCTKLYGRLPQLGIQRPCFAGFGRAAESGPFVGYWFRKANRLAQTLFLSFEEVHKFDPRKHDALVLLDDFVGTGVQAVDLWKKISTTFELRKKPCMAYLGLVGFREAKELVAQDTDMRVELAHELTDVDRASFHHTFGDSFKTKAAIKTLAEYGRRLEPRYPLGYNDTAALVAFFYDTPNNTLPVVWSGENGWVPLFQRHASRSSVAGRKNNLHPPDVGKNVSGEDTLALHNAYAQYLKRHEAVFDCEAPQYKSFFDHLNSKALVAAVKLESRILYALPRLAVAAGLAAGRNSTISLSAFSNLPTNAISASVKEHPHTFEADGPRISLRKLSGKLVIFDWSDTLVDEYDLDEAICSFIPTAEPSRKKEESGNVLAFRQMLSDLERDSSHLWYDYLFLGRQFAKGSDDLRREHVRNGSKMRPLCEITPLIRAVRKAGFSTALATNCVKPVLGWRAQILGLELKSLFDLVVTSDQVSSVKDKGVHFDYILHQRKIGSSDVIVVGDRFDKDILPAKMRGLQTVWVRSPIQRRRSYSGTPELPTPHSSFELARSSVPGNAADRMIVDIKHFAVLLGLDG